MMTIYKYFIDTTDRQTVQMPAGAKILCVQVQPGGPHLWALVNPDNPVTENRHIAVYGTGHPIEVSGDYIGTYQLVGGSLVFHVFENPGPEVPEPESDLERDRRNP